MANLDTGRELNRALDEIARRLRRASYVKVGFLEKATYSDGTPVAMIAAIQDFGAPSRGIPPRPFFRNMIREKQRDWPGQIAGLLRGHNYDAERVLSMMGEVIAGDLRQSIRDTNDPPLAASTIARKGFDKPLVDTGHLLASVDYEIEDERP